MLFFAFAALYFGLLAFDAGLFDAIIFLALSLFYWVINMKASFAVKKGLSMYYLVEIADTLQIWVWFAISPCYQLIQYMLIYAGFTYIHDSESLIWSHYQSSKKNIAIAEVI